MTNSSSGERPPFKSGQAGRTGPYSSLPFYEDHSDRKALDNLVEKLISTQKNTIAAKNSSPNGSKYTQPSISSYCLRPGKCGSKPTVQDHSKPLTKSKSKKACNADSKVGTCAGKVASGKINKKITSKRTAVLPKLDGWLSRNGSSPIEKGIVAEKLCGKVKNKKEVFVENRDDSKTPVKKSRKLERQSSGSFDKYGIHLPSFEEIVAYQKKLKADKKCLDSIHILEDSQEEFNIDEPEPPAVVLDCKHLTENEIEAGYNRNSQYAYEIFEGIRHSTRHERFKKQNYQDNFTVNDLKFNTSTITFSYDQKRQLLTRLREQFDAEDGSHNQYFYKVLLPELCLKIFMDTHNMNCEEATAYLENRPVVIY